MQIIKIPFQKQTLSALTWYSDVCMVQPLLQIKSFNFSETYLLEGEPSSRLKVMIVYSSSVTNYENNSIKKNIASSQTNNQTRSFIQMVIFVHKIIRMSISGLPFEIATSEILDPSIFSVSFTTVITSSWNVFLSVMLLK